jgi:hypothetical protein
VAEVPMTIEEYRREILRAMGKGGLDLVEPILAADKSFTSRERRVADLLEKLVMRSSADRPPDFPSLISAQSNYWEYRVAEAVWWFARARKFLKDMEADE